MYLCKFVRDCILIINRGAVNCRLRNDFKGRGLKMGVFVGGGGGGVDLDLDFKNFWDGVYNFFFAPPSIARKENLCRIFWVMKL